MSPELVCKYFKTLKNYATSLGCTIKYEGPLEGFPEAIAGYMSQEKEILLFRVTDSMKGIWDVAHEIGHHVDLTVLKNDSAFSIKAAQISKAYWNVGLATPQNYADEVLRCEYEANRWAWVIIQHLQIPITENFHIEQSKDLIEAYRSKLQYREAA